MGLSLGLISCGLFLLLLINYSSEAEVVTVDVKAAKGFLESGYIYLDVRCIIFPFVTIVLVFFISSFGFVQFSFSEIKFIIF